MVISVVEPAKKAVKEDEKKTPVTPVPTVEKEEEGDKSEPFVRGAKKNKVLGCHRLHIDVPYPEQKTEGAACFDVAFWPVASEYRVYNHNNTLHMRQCAGDAAQIRLMPNERVLVPTGLIFDIPEGYHIKLHVRSSTGIKLGLSNAHSTGIVDSDYTGELFMPLINNSDSPVTISKGDRLCQIELVKNVGVTIKPLRHAPEAKGNRAHGSEGGLGSTGQN